MPRLRLLIVVIVIACVELTARADFDPLVFLRTHASFSTDDFAKLERGETIAHAITADGSEVAIAAATMMAIPIEFYLQQFHAIEAFKRTAEVLQIGRFSAVPSQDDLRALTLEAGDVSALRECRVGSCDVKLDAAGITQVSRAPDISEAFRIHLAGYAARYLREGNAALMTYHDRREPHPLVNDLSRIVARSSILLESSAAIRSAVVDFRGRLPADLEQFLYWSKEKPAGKAVVSVTHAIIHPETQGLAVIATKQLYASHYLTGSLGLTVLVNRGTPDAPRTLIVYVNRTRVDVFDGVLGRLKRPIVRSRARGGTEDLLERLGQRLEAEYRAAPKALVVPTEQRLRNVKGEALRRFDQGRILQRERTDVLDPKLPRRPIEERDIDPLRFVCRPPAQTCSSSVPLEERTGLRLRQAPVPGGDR